MERQDLKYLISQTIKKWHRDKTSRMAAALAYYAIFTIPPLFIITLLLALIYKVVPDVKIEWKDVWIGATVTALLFTVGKWGVSFYLGQRAPASTYGAAGWLIVVLLWVFFAAQILFLGAEFTQVYANRYGSRLVPERGAVPLTQTAGA